MNCQPSSVTILMQLDSEHLLFTQPLLFACLGILLLTLVLGTDLMDAKLHFYPIPFDNFEGCSMRCGMWK